MVKHIKKRNVWTKTVNAHIQKWIPTNKYIANQIQIILLDCEVVQKKSLWFSFVQQFNKDLWYYSLKNDISLRHRHDRCKVVENISSLM